MTKPTDIVGYTFDHQDWCTYCIEQYIRDCIPQDGHSNATVDRGIEYALDKIAISRGINRYNESSYDSKDFPKVIFASSIENEAFCDICFEPLI